MKILIYFLFPVILFWCCKSSSEPQSKPISTLKYAKGFSISHLGDTTLVEVYNPWDNNKLLSHYKLVKKKDTQVQANHIIQVPADRIASLSSTYTGMLSILNARDRLIACANANWLVDSVLYARFINGDLTNLGNELNTDAENVLSKNPGVVLKYIYQSPDPIDPILLRAGIPVVYIIEFMEDHPLGRAEWIKLVGALLDKEALADSVFQAIESNYINVKNLASTDTNRPSVLDGTIYKGNWFAAGGNSFVAQLIRDANAGYAWSGDSSRGSLNLSFEAVIHRQQDADFWINASAGSLQEIESIEPRCKILQSFQQGQVYHYNKRVNPNGGLDYFETGVVRPDLLLRDLLIILHPGIIDEETVYYKKLE
ncbi:MAG: ABC transporter substrate-binding protein [Bacteroidota bacterium]|nr:MAG: ABC transporter substrate-binding protein [Bacteroidota bacterium]